MATYTYDLEDVTWKVLEYLQDNMYDKLAAIELVKTDAPLNLENIERYFFGDKDFNPETQNLPAIIVKGRNWSLEPTALNNLYKDEMKIEVECYLGSDANQSTTVNGHTYDFDELLDMKIMRYARAIVEVIVENECLGGLVEAIDVSDVLVSNVIPFDSVMIKACRIDLTVHGISNTLK